LALSAPVDCDPLMALPDQPPEATHEVALVEDQVRVAAPPLATVLGLAARLTVGASRRGLDRYRRRLRSAPSGPSAGQRVARGGRHRARGLRAAGGFDAGPGARGAAGRSIGGGPGQCRAASAGNDARAHAQADGRRRGYDGGLRERELLQEIAQSLEMPIYAGAINRDHVHLLIGILPNISGSRQCSIRRVRVRTSY
jgi:hypothetical protein